MGEVAVQEISMSRVSSVVRSRIAILSLVLILGIAAVSRVAVIEADPPPWMQGAFISDEGWWADGARGKIFFNNYYDDDFGTAYLITPAYTWILEAVYRIWGVGTVQTRMVEALASLLTIALVALLLWRRAGPPEAQIVALMLTVSPFYWSYGRVGLQEPIQGMLIAASFVLWVFSDRSRLAGLAAGTAMGFAIAVKPNAVGLGFFPLTVAAGCGFIVEYAGLAPAGRARLRHATMARMAWVAAGMGVVLGYVFFTHALPNWQEFRAVAVAESGAYEATWKERLQILGMLMMSTEMRGIINTPIAWNPAHWSPALLTCFWLVLLTVMMRLRNGLGALARSMDGLEATALGWTLGTSLIVGTAYYQPDRRYVLLFPPLAVVVALFLGRAWRAARPPARLQEGPGRGWFFSLALWFVLGLPVMVFLKPLVARVVMKLGEGIHLGRDAGLGYATAGMIFMMGWLAVLGLLAFRRGWAERICAAILGNTRILALSALLLAIETGVIAYQFAVQGTTMAEQQVLLGGIIRDGETVMGHVATTVLMPLKVHTVRRVSPFEYTPPPNPDVWERLKPRYILEMTRRNFGPARTLYSDLVDLGDYRVIHRFEVGPWRDGEPRYVFNLYYRGSFPFRRAKFIRTP